MRAAAKADRPRLVYPSTEFEFEMDGIRELFQEYAQSLKIGLCFQNFPQELPALPGEYRPPRGALVAAMVQGHMAGCCAMRSLDTVNYPNACEMKRLFVRPNYRGLDFEEIPPYFFNSITGPHNLKADL